MLHTCLPAVVHPSHFAAIRLRVDTERNVACPPSARSKRPLTSRDAAVSRRNQWTSLPTTAIASSSVCRARVAATASTVYQVGSLSKQFTAAAVLLVVTGSGPLGQAGWSGGVVVSPR